MKITFTLTAALLFVLSFGNVVHALREEGGGGGGGGGLPPTATLTASPTSIAGGQSVTLTWSSARATLGCYGTNFDTAGAISGSVSVTPSSTTTYTVTCDNDNGSASASRTVTVTGGTPAPTASLSASPSSITSGQSATLSWSSTNATSCTGTNFNTSGATNGSVSMSPGVSTSYSVSCSGAGGSVSYGATITVSPGSSCASFGEVQAPNQFWYLPPQPDQYITDARCCGGTGFIGYATYLNNGIYCGVPSGNACSPEGAVIEYLDPGTYALTFVPNADQCCSGEAVYGGIYENRVTCYGGACAPDGTVLGQTPLTYINVVEQSDDRCCSGASAYGGQYGRDIVCLDTGEEDPNAPWVNMGCGVINDSYNGSCNPTAEPLDIECAPGEMLQGRTVYNSPFPYCSAPNNPSREERRCVEDASCAAGAALSVSCSVSPTTASIGENVTWVASASGGSASGAGGWVEIGYNANKCFDTCPTGFDSLLTNGGSCSPVGSTCTYCQYGTGSFDTSIYQCQQGSSGSPYTYAWSGTDGLSGTTASVSKSYSIVGTKTGSVTVTSGSGTGNWVLNTSLPGEEICHGNASPAFGGVACPSNLGSSCVVGTQCYVVTPYGQETWPTCNVSGPTFGNASQYVCQSAGSQTVTQACSTSVSVLSSSDLTAGAIIPTTATVGTAVTLSATISNIGAASTGLGFTNLFQRATDASGAGATDIGTHSGGAVAAGGTQSATLSYTFPSVATWYVRACADKNSAGSSGVITESNENNNCGAWTAVIVSAAPAECSDGVSNDSDGLIDCADSGCWATPGNPASCDPNDDNEDPNPPTVTFSCSNPSPCTISPGGTATLTWDTTGYSSCVGSGFSTGGGNPADGSAPVSPVVTTSYGLTCDGAAIPPVTVTVTQPYSYIEATPDRVNQGSQTTVRFSANQVLTSCEVRQNGTRVWGPTVPVPVPGAIATTTLPNITIQKQTTFTIVCDTGAGAATDSVIVNVVPTFQEF